VIQGDVRFNRSRVNHAPPACVTHGPSPPCFTCVQFALSHAGSALLHHRPSSSLLHLCRVNGLSANSEPATLPVSQSCNAPSRIGVVRSYISAPLMYHASPLPLGPYTIFFYRKDFVRESMPFCVNLPCGWASHDPPSSLTRLHRIFFPPDPHYCNIYHTILVMAISCKGQPPPLYLSRATRPLACWSNVRSTPRPSASRVPPSCITAPPPSGYPPRVNPIIGNSTSNHFGAQGTLNPEVAPSGSLTGHG